MLIAGNAALALTIPQFSSNIVDPDAYLTDSERQEVDQLFEELRASSAIYPALYIVKNLQGQSIESVAEEAFKSWQLGAKGLDNGLLLVLAMENRKSRFEVGYGLEGTLTDLAARITLDEHLAPLMRENKLKEAVMASFKYLSYVQQKDPEALAEIQAALQKQEEGSFSLRLEGLFAYLVFLFILWRGLGIAKILDRRKAQRLEQISSYRMSQDPRFNGDMSAALALHKRLNKTSSSFRLPLALFLKLFFTLNPGLFVLLVPSILPGSGYVFMLLMILGFSGYCRMSSRRYVVGSKNYQDYQKYLEKNQESILAVGKATDEELLKVQIPQSIVTPFGIFMMSSSVGSRVHNRGGSGASSRPSSGSSSSSSRSSTSSSGGGRSGGGGASSSW